MRFLFDRFGSTGWWLAGYCLFQVVAIGHAQPCPENIRIDSPTLGYLCDGYPARLVAPPGFETYQWSNGQVQPELEVWQPGLYFLTATRPGCTWTDSITIRKAPPLHVRFIVSPPSCAQVNDASVYVDRVGGSGRCQYRLNQGPLQASAIFTDLAPGTYRVQVLDATGCSAENSVVIPPGTRPEKPPARLKAFSPTEPSLLLEWEALPCITRYEVAWRLVGQPDWHSLYTLAPSCTLDDLRPSTGYEWTVRGFTASGDSTLWAMPHTTLTEGCWQPHHLGHVALEHPQSGWVVPRVYWEQFGEGLDYIVAWRTTRTADWQLLRTDRTYVDLPTWSKVHPVHVKVRARCTNGQQSTYSPDYVFEFRESEPVFQLKSKYRTLVVQAGPGPVQLTVLDDLDQVVKHADFNPTTRQALVVPLPTLIPGNLYEAKLVFRNETFVFPFMLKD
jgi:hypothetical protein